MTTRTCPNCQKDRVLHRHWAADPNCDPPDLTGEQKAFIDTILLAGGTIDATDHHKTVRFATTNRHLIETLSDGLGYLTDRDSKLSRHDDEDVDAYRDRRIEATNDVSTDVNPTAIGTTIYVLETIAHPNLTEYLNERWYRGEGRGRRRTTPSFTPEPNLLRAIYAAFGTVYWKRHSDERNAYINFDTSKADLDTERAVSLLDSAGFTPHTREDDEFVGTGDVSLPTSETGAFIDPLPDKFDGKEHLWCVDDYKLHSAIEDGTEAFVTAKLNGDTVEHHLAPVYSQHDCGAWIDVDGGSHRSAGSAYDASQRVGTGEEKHVYRQCNSPGMVTVDGDAYCVGHAVEFYPDIEPYTSILADGRERAMFFEVEETLTNIQSSVDTYKERSQTDPGVMSAWDAIRELASLINQFADAYSHDDQFTDDFEWLLNEKFGNRL